MSTPETPIIVRHLRCSALSTQCSHWEVRRRVGRCVDARVMNLGELGMLGLLLFSLLLRSVFLM